MISAKEARTKTLTYHNCQDKMAYYEEYVDKQIREAANNGRNQVIIKISENIFTEHIVEHVGAILLDKGFTVQASAKGYVSYLMVVW